MDSESDIELSSSSFSNTYPPSIEEHEGIDKKKSSSRIGGLSHSVEVNPDLENEPISREGSTELIQTILTTVGTEIANPYEAPKTSLTETTSQYSVHTPPSEKPKKKFYQRLGFSQAIPSLFRRKVDGDLSTKRHVPSLSMTTSSYSTLSIASSSSSSSAASSSSSVASSPRTAAKTLKKLNQLTRLSQSKLKKHSKLTDGASVITRALAAERILTNQINERLSLLDKDRPLSEQEAILRKVTKLINRLKEINVTLTELPRDFYLQSASADIRRIAERQIIKTHQPENSMDSEAEMAFLEKADIGVIVNMMKIESSELGREFIREFAQSLTEKNQTLRIETVLRDKPASLKAIFLGTPMHAKIGIRPGANCPENLRLLAREVDNVDSQIFIRQAGAPPSLIFPIWLNINPEYLEDTWENEVWGSKSTNEALGDVLSGNFSFDNQSRMFYTPLHIEIAHELIHALHYSQGMSADELQMPSPLDSLLWTDFEEYVAITGGKFTEIAIAADFDLSQRHGHTGMAFASLANRDPVYMSSTPRQIEGVTEQIDPHHHED